MKHRWKRTASRSVILIAALALVAAACGDSDDTTTTAAAAAPAEPVEMVDVQLQLQWFTQSQFAGYYAAVDQGFYEELGLNVEILEGGVDIVPAVV